MNKRSILNISVLGLALIILSSLAMAEELTLAEKLADKGIGAMKIYTGGNKVDAKLAEEGKVLFEANCSKCHKLQERYTGPALIGVTKRRSPEWIINMITNTDVMVKEDKLAKLLLAKYLKPMSGLEAGSEADQIKKATLIYEYMKAFDSK